MRQILWNPGVADFLRTLGASRDVIAFIDGQSDPKLQGKLANEVRKKPGIVLAELAMIAMRYEREAARKAPTAAESTILKRVMDRAGTLVGATRGIVTDLKFWFAIQLVKHRKAELKKIHPHDPPEYEYRRELFDTDATRRLEEVLRRAGSRLLPLPADRQLSLARSSETSGRLWHLAALVTDWAVGEEVEIASYSWPAAIEAAIAWHSRDPGEKVGGYDSQDPRLTLYTFKDGWTLRQIGTEQDVYVDGAYLSNCMQQGWNGPKFWRAMQKGHTVILSLRDAENKPHVAIEFSGGDKHGNGFLQQALGYKNGQPTREEEKRLTEAFGYLNSHGYELYADYDRWDDLISNVKSREIETRDLASAIRDESVTGIYGLPSPVPFDRDTFNNLHTALIERLFDRNQDYYGWMRNVADAMADRALEHDLGIDRIQKLIEKVKQGKCKALYLGDFDEKDTCLSLLYDIHEKNWKWAQSNWFYEPGPPAEEDFETKEEYQKAQEKWEEDEREWFDYGMQEGSFGFDQDMLKFYLEKAEKAGVVMGKEGD